MAHSPFLFWDGRKDSLWAQALGPLESPVEHGGRREQYAEAIAAHFRPDYEVIFGPMPALSTLDEATAVFVNMGKAIAAYERTIVHAPSRFDRYVDALQDTGRAAHGVLSSDEVDGLRLFIAIPGAAELVGKGVYRGLPNAIPQPVRNRNAVVVGKAAECASAATQLCKAGWSVTVVTRERCGCRVGRECRRRLGTEVVCAAGGDYLEAVVLRRIDTGRVDACNASALFIM